MKKMIQYIRAGVGDLSDLEEIEKKYAWKLHDFIFFFSLIFTAGIFIDKNYNGGVFTEATINYIGINFTIQDAASIELKFAYLVLYVIFFFSSFLVFCIYVAFNKSVAFFLNLSSIIKFVITLVFILPTSFIGIWLVISALGLLPYHQIAMLFQILLMAKFLAFFGLWLFGAFLSLSYVRNA